MHVRDFIYMDVERLKSALAQLDSGVLETVTQSGQHSKEVSAGAQGKIAGIVGLSGNADFVWANETSETRALHDNVYNLVEAALAETGSLFQIPGDITLEDVAAGELQRRLDDTQFVLVSGYATLNDFGHVRHLFDRFNDIGKFLAYCTASGIESKQERQTVRRATEGQMHLDKELVEGFDIIFDTFYKGRIVIKMRPIVDDATGSLVGVLRPDFLREPSEVLLYKYGESPRRPWRMLAQVASIPIEHELGPEVPPSGGDIEKAMMEVFSSMKTVQAGVQTVQYPEIAVTPIAVFRE